VRLLGHRDLNHTTKPRISVTPMMNTGVDYDVGREERVHRAQKWCQTACHLEAQTCLATCACWLSPRRQHSRTSPASWYGLKRPNLRQSSAPGRHRGIRWSLLLRAAGSNLSFRGICGARAAPGGELEQVDARRVHRRNPSPVGSPSSYCSPGV
jgi:hypothetical protein